MGRYPLTQTLDTTNMLRTLAFALCLGLALAAAPKATHDDWVAPEFCNGVDCPKFTLLEANDVEGWEKRAYEEAMWVSTTVEAVPDNVDEQLRVAFNRLYGYLGGQNDAGIIFNVTAPVTTKVLPGQGPNCNSFFTQSFFIPYAYQASPPAPLDPEVFLERFPAATIYAEIFEGYAVVSDFLIKIVELSESIGQENHETAFWYGSFYDSPFQPFERHNEAWLIAK